jgi:FKBP-type peptidyl-prolyl cis-trans isomerase 2
MATRRRSHAVTAALTALAALATVLVACGDSEGNARVAQDGDKVQVHYHGTLDDGEVFDSSRERAPLPFTVGSGGVINGFDDAVRGLAVGESVTVRLEPADAYGERSDDRILSVPIDQVPEGVSVGAQLQLSNGLRATVTAVSDETVTLDANHELAGKALTFEIELVSIE